MAKPAYWLVIHPKTGARLCRDGKWREHALFGTGKRCVKQYKTSGWAQRAANRCRVDGETLIVPIYPGEIVEAGGRHYKKVPSEKNGYERIVTLNDWSKPKPHWKVAKNNERKTSPDYANSIF